MVYVCKWEGGGEMIGGRRGNDRREEGCVMCSWEGIISGRRVCSL